VALWVLGHVFDSKLFVDLYFLYIAGLIFAGEGGRGEEERLILSRQTHANRDLELLLLRNL
jgi:hypothetical protein